jgi:hypothetical protein
MMMTEKSTCDILEGGSRIFSDMVSNSKAGLGYKSGSSTQITECWL